MDRESNADGGPFAVSITLFPSKPDEAFTPARQLSLVSAIPKDCKLRLIEYVELFSSRLAARLSVAGAALVEGRQVNDIAFNCPDVLVAEIIAVGFAQLTFKPSVPITIAEMQADGEFAQSTQLNGTSRRVLPVEVTFGKGRPDGVPEKTDLGLDEVAYIIDSAPEWTTLLTGESDEIISRFLAKKYAAAGYSFARDKDDVLSVELLFDVKI
jgi:hypothetical protein